MVWRDGSKVKSMHCSSDHLSSVPSTGTWWSTAPVTPAPRDLTPSMDLHGYLCSRTQIHTQTHSFKKKSKS
ncbi:hypothetical protein I79_006535 [Cricetulus griseus]|uniref:Uncharacterized protein n=1 Tax=Cricetulus griseus TaxID=10029 RepID=G3H838_CRIGR|nr:hypothetical protein I79_006535 [Cricetulus griseus]